MQSYSCMRGCITAPDVFKYSQDNHVYFQSCYSPFKLGESRGVTLLKVRVSMLSGENLAFK